MALGEYVSVSSQSDSQKALIAKERHELATMPDEELAELAAIYQAKGLSPTTAKTVALELTAHDALALMAESREAHGEKNFARVRDISVRYEGQWASIGPRFQPVLADTKFRRDSEERLFIGAGIMAQEHSGPLGKKLVVREPGAVAVSYNGEPSSSEEGRAAAALVADAYTMFLLGPFYFDRPGTLLTSAGQALVDGAQCDQVLALLRPGIGITKEDRVILSIDRASKQLRRVRMTLNGLESTKGAEVDVTFRQFRTIGGILWPTDFDERIRVPFDLHAHHWKMTGLEINRGYRASDLKGMLIKGTAAAPAAPLPADHR